MTKVIEIKNEEDKKLAGNFALVELEAEDVDEMTTATKLLWLKVKLGLTVHASYVRTELKWGYPKQRYIITVKRIRTGEQFTFSYWTPREDRERVKLGALGCLLSDAYCYETSQWLEDFLASLGYDLNPDKYDSKNTYKEGVKAYNGCARQHERLHKLFNNDEVEQLSHAIEVWGY